LDPQLEVSRTTLIRDLLLFQAKLLVDGLKDLVLIKLALLAVVADLALGGRRRGRIFYGLLRGGERFDLWLNLYRPASAPATEAAASPVASADHLARGVESMTMRMLDALRHRAAERHGARGAARGATR
jgi:hypothetical protein